MPRAATCCGRADRGLQRHCRIDLAQQSGPGARNGDRRRSERQHDGRGRRQRRPALDHGARSEPGRHHHGVADRSWRIASTSTPRRTKRHCPARCRATVAARFAGSMLALDLHTGRIVWQSFVLPDNGGQPGGFAGGAFVNPPAIDLKHGLVYGAAGQVYTQPDGGDRVPRGAPDGWSEDCFPRTRISTRSSRSICARAAALVLPRRRSRCVAARLRKPPPSVTWCPPAGTATGPFQRLGFRRRRRERLSCARERPVTRCRRHRPEERRVLGARRGHRRAPVEHAWSAWRPIRAASSGARRTTGTGSTPRSATTRAALHAALGRHHHRRLVGRAVDPSNGRILWQTADPFGRAGSRIAHRRERRRSTPDRWRTPAIRCTRSTRRRRHPLAVRGRRIGGRRTCGRGRHGLLGLGLRAHRRRRQQQVLRVQRRGTVGGDRDRRRGEGGSTDVRTDPRTRGRD